MKVWDVRTGQALLTSRGLVWGVAFSPDGQRLASASFREVKVWDGGSGQELLTFRGHTGPVHSVAFSADGQRLASASFREVKVWDGHSGQDLLTFRGHRGWVSAVAFSPDGQRLASASDDSTPAFPVRGAIVKVWDAHTGKELLSLDSHAHKVHSVAFSPDGQRLASAGFNQVKVWDARSGQELLTFRGHTGPVHSVAFSPDGQTLFSRGPELLAWDAKTGARLSAPRQPLPFLNGIGAFDLAFPTDVAGHHPSGPVLALPVGEQIKLIDLRPPDDVELRYREAMIRFDPAWHKEQAQTYEKAASWYAAAFHWSQLAEHDPNDAPAWQHLEAACSRLGNWQLALRACQRALERDPTQAAVYLRRARLRATLGQFHEATADHLAGLALLARTRRP
jgi:WD40 repeat protein